MQEYLSDMKVLLRNKKVEFYRTRRVKIEITPFGKVPKAELIYIATYNIKKYSYIGKWHKVKKIPISEMGLNSLLDMRTETFYIVDTYVKSEEFFSFLFNFKKEK